MVSATEWILVVCCPLWATATPCSYIYNNENRFTITAITEQVDGTWHIAIAGNGIDQDLPFTLDLPQFMHGTRTAVNQELNSKPDSFDKWPMCYLYEVIEEKFFKEDSSAFERETDLLLFFLDESKKEEWTTTCHYDQVIEPMANLAHLFASQAEEGCAEIADSYSLVYHANFGNYDRKGHYEKIFSNNLSGVALKIKLKIETNSPCLTC